MKVTGHVCNQCFCHTGCSFQGSIQVIAVHSFSCHRTRFLSVYVTCTVGLSLFTAKEHVSQVHLPSDLLNPSLRQTSAVMGVHAGLFDVSLSLLEAWAQQHAVSHTPAEGANANVEEVPRWVDALLLCLDMGMQPQPAPQPEQPSAAAASAAPSTSAAAASDGAIAGQTPSTTAPTPASATPAVLGASGAPAASSAAQTNAGGAAQTTAGPSTASAEEKKTESPVTKSAEERQQAATQLLRDNIKTMFLPNGLLSQQHLERAATVCMKLLQHLHAWGSAWKVPSGELSESEAFARPQPASTTQAVVQVLARVTKSHAVALKVHISCQLASSTLLFFPHQSQHKMHAADGHTRQDVSWPKAQHLGQKLCILNFL